MNIAILSPNQNQYSETFIKAHKELLPGNVFFYAGSLDKITLNGASLGRFPKSRLAGLWARRVLKKSAKDLYSERLVNSFKDHKIDVILVEYGNHAHRLLPVLENAQIPFIAHYHGYDASVYTEIEGCSNYQELFAKAAGIIAVSRAMEDQLLALGCPREKLHYNVYGPWDRFLEIEARFTKKQCLAVGRFTDKKAPYFNILAFAQAVKKHPDAKLLMAGDGKLLNTCKNLVAHLGLENSVTFLGVVSPQQIEEYLFDSYCFVQHSMRSDTGDMEGTPLSILEAQAAGIPVVSTIHAGIPDVVLHNQTGLLCAEGDVNAMGEHLTTIFDSLDNTKAMGAAAKERIKSEFTMSRHIEALHSILKKAADS